MKNRKKNSDNDQQIKEYDPDPLTIALSIITALSPIGALIADKSIDLGKENRRREQDVRRALFRSSRALNQTVRILRDFVSFMNEQGLLDREVRLGRASLKGNPQLISELKSLYRDSCNAGRQLNESMIDLSFYLTNQDFDLVKTLSEKLDGSLHTALSSKDYKGYVVATARLTNEVGNLLRIIGEGYDFNPTESQLFR